MTLNAGQKGALRMIADIGSGVAIHRSTARALERRGLVTIGGAAVMSSGVSCRLTNAGRKEALAAWREWNDRFRALRGRDSDMATDIIEKLRR